MVAAFGAVLGWLLKVVWDLIQSLDADLKVSKRDLHTQRVVKNKYRYGILEAKNILKQLFDVVTVTSGQRWITL